MFQIRGCRCENDVCFGKVCTVIQNDEMRLQNFFGKLSIWVLG